MAARLWDTMLGVHVGWVRAIVTIGAAVRWMRAARLEMQTVTLWFALDRQKPPELAPSKDASPVDAEPRIVGAISVCDRDAPLGYQQ